MKISIISILLVASFAIAKESEQTSDSQDKKRIPSSTKINGTFEFKTQKVGKKTVVCGVALADGTYSYGGGSGASASVNCVIVDNE